MKRPYALDAGNYIDLDEVARICKIKEKGIPAIVIILKSGHKLTMTFSVAGMETGGDYQTRDKRFEEILDATCEGRRPLNVSEL